MEKKPLAIASEEVEVAEENKTDEEPSARESTGEIADNIEKSETKSKPLSFKQI